MKSIISIIHIKTCFYAINGNVLIPRFLVIEVKLLIMNFKEITMVDSEED